MSYSSNWRDKYGLIHLEPKPEPNQTENPALFSSTYIVLKYITKTLTEDDAYRYLASIDMLIKEDLKGSWVWYTTPLFKFPHFSRDDFTGVIAAVKCLKEYANKISDDWLEELADRKIDQIPLFHKQLDHPRDFILVGYAKYPWIFFLLWPIYCLAMIVSCWQTHKVRKGLSIAKTDGKIMAFLICKAYNLRLTFWICDWLVKKRKRTGQIPRYTIPEGYHVDGSWKWVNWVNVFKDFYRNHEHPNVKYIELWEQTL